MRAPPGLPAAARWLVDRVQIPIQRGFGRVKERDRFRCQNPECGRLTLRCEAHHIVFRSRGGSDDLQNGVTVCRACHLRAIHTGRITVELVVLGGGVEAVLWTYLGERRVVVLRGPRD